MKAALFFPFLIIIGLKISIAQSNFEVANVPSDKVLYFIHLSQADRFSQHKDAFLFNKTRMLRDSLYRVDSLNFHISLNYRNWYLSRISLLQKKLPDTLKMNDGQKRTLKKQIRQLKDSLSIATNRLDKILKNTPNKQELRKEIYAQYAYHEGINRIDTISLELCVHLGAAVSVDNEKNQTLFEKAVSLTDSLQKLAPDNYFLTHQLGALYHNKSLDIIKLVNSETASTEEMEKALQESEVYQKKSEPYLKKAEKLARRSR